MPVISEEILYKELRALADRMDRKDPVVEAVQRINLLEKRLSEILGNLGEEDTKDLVENLRRIKNYIQKIGVPTEYVNEIKIAAKYINENFGGKLGKIAGEIKEMLKSNEYPAVFNIDSALSTIPPALERLAKYLSQRRPY